MRHLFTSRFLYAVIVFGALSLCAGLTRFWQAKPTDYPYRSWTAWAIDDFLQKKQAPQLVFMGSSLVLVPVSGVDANYLHHRIDGALHHSSHYFEDKFREKVGFALRTFDFALPGEMPSDAYMITDFLLKGKKQPGVIVWGVGPRDFMDNLLPSPAATDPFLFLSRFGDISTMASLMMPEWTERFNYELGRAVYLYGHRQDLDQCWQKLAARPIDKYRNVLSADKTMTVAEVRQIVPSYRPFEVGKGEAFFRPLSVAEKGQFLDNIDEYRKRYKKLKWPTFRTQMHFFESALALARERGIKVVVVAMPITDINRGLLSAAAMKTYKTTVRDVADGEGAAFIDLTDDPRFTRADFGDTVHLHAGGGLRWMDILVDKLALDKMLVSALRKQQPNDASVCQTRGSGESL